MKKLFVLISMIGIIIGMVLPTFAASPDKAKDENSKVDPALLPDPLTTWTLTVYIDDADIDCPAQYCTLRILMVPADSYCVPVSSTLLVDFRYTPGTSLYYFNGSTNYAYGLIYLYDGSGSCEYNKNICCETIGNNMSCHLYVCK